MDYLTKIKTSDQFIKEFEEIRRIKTDKDIEAGLDEISKRTPANTPDYMTANKYMKQNKDNMEMIEERRLKNDSIRDKLAYLDNQIEYYEKKIEMNKEFIKKGDHVDIHKGTIENYKLRIEVLKKDKEYLNTLQHLSRIDENPFHPNPEVVGLWGYEGVTYYPQFKTYDEALVAEQNYQNKTLDQLIEHMKRMQTQLDKHDALLTNEPVPLSLVEGVKSSTMKHETSAKSNIAFGQCYYCFKKLDGKSLIIKAKCGHFFHKACILKWINQEKMPHCPRDGKDIKVEELNEATPEDAKEQSNWVEGGRKTKKNKTTQKKYKKNRRTKSIRRK